MERKEETYIEYDGAAHLRTSGRLPHLELDGGIYFITFNLADAMPPPKRRKLKRTLRKAVRRYIDERDPSPAELARYRARLAEQLFEGVLDEGLGSCLFRSPNYARLVIEAIEFHDSELYELAALVIMPNHCHVLLRLTEGALLATVTHSWKSFTSQMIKKAEGTLGDGESLWQKESHDRVVRTAEEFCNTFLYIRNNPKKAGLGDQLWFRTYEQEWVQELFLLAGDVTWWA